MSKNPFRLTLFADAAKPDDPLVVVVQLPLLEIRRVPASITPAQLEAIVNYLKAGVEAGVAEWRAMEKIDN